MCGAIAQRQAGVVVPARAVRAIWRRLAYRRLRRAAANGESGNARRRRPTRSSRPRPGGSSRSYQPHQAACAPTPGYRTLAPAPPPLALQVGVFCLIPGLEAGNGRAQRRRKRECADRASVKHGCPPCDRSTGSRGKAETARRAQSLYCAACRSSKAGRCLRAAKGSDRDRKTWTGCGSIARKDGRQRLMA